MNNYEKNDDIVIMEEGQNQMPETKVSAGKWHYVKVFCTFFSLIATFACFCFCTELRSDFMGLLTLMWGIGVIAALLVAPGKFFIFAWGVICTCATFGWFLLPFPFDLITVAISAFVGIAVAVLALVAVPAIFTIYTYITDIRYACKDVKKEIIAAVAGVGAVLVCIALFLGMTTISKAMEAPEMERKFDVTKIYQEYLNDNPTETVYPNEVVNNPVSMDVMDDGYIRECYYEFEQLEGSLYFQYKVNMEFEYVHDEWKIVDVYEEKEAVRFEPVSGSWTGTGNYPANLSVNNQYVCTLAFSAENGGTGSIDVFLKEENIAHMEFTIQFSELDTENALSWSNKYGNITKLTLVLEEPVSFKSFGVGKTYTEVECVYSFDENMIIMDTFDYGMKLK